MRYSANISLNVFSGPRLRLIHLHSLTRNCNVHIQKCYLWLLFIISSIDRVHLSASL